MPTGEIALWKGTGCLGSGLYPAINLYGDIGSPVKTFTGKFTEDLDQAVTIPHFAGWTDCNLCTLTPTGGARTWYWITDISRSTDLKGSVTLALSYCPTMDIGDVVGAGAGVDIRIRGNWKRLSNVSARNQSERFSCADGPEVRQNAIVDIPTIADEHPSDLYGPIAWCQIVHSDNATAENRTGIKRIGFFIAVKSMSASLFAGSSAYYPNLNEVMSDTAGALGITASTIIDISMSPICPYEYGETSDGALRLGSNGSIAPTIRTRSGGTSVAYYGDLGTTPYVRQKSFTLTNTQKCCSSLYVVDLYGSCIGQLNWNDYHASDTESLDYRVESDFTGMTLRIDHKSKSIAVQLPHIPYVGTQWSEYRAYSMSLDRQAMEFAINQSHESMAIQKDTALMTTALGVGNSLMSGNFSGAANQIAGTLISMQAQDRQQTLSDKAARFSQQMAESRAKSAPPTVYASGYGLAEIWRYVQGYRYKIEAWAPAGTSDSRFTAYVNAYGMPCTMIDASTGFYGDDFFMGQLRNVVDGAKVITGPKLDRLGSLLLGGLKTVKWENKG